MEIVYVVLAVIAFCAVIAGIISKLGNDVTEERVDALYKHLNLTTRVVPAVEVPAHLEVVKFQSLDEFMNSMEVTEAPKSTKKRA